MFQNNITTSTQNDVNKFDTNERALQDNLIDDELLKMDLLVYDNEERIQSALNTEELINILEDKKEDDLENVEDTYIIDNKPDEYCIKSIDNLGNFIMNFSYVFEQLHKQFDEHSRGIECCFRDLIFIGIRAHGLRNQLFFKCRMCNYERSIWSEPPPEENLDTNTGAVAGTILTGMGYTQLKESLAAVNISCMNNKTYQKLHEKVAAGFEKAAEDSMKAAAEEERTLAIQHNDIINGIPHIAVIADGSWMKRSYRTGRYDSLSGVGTICGARTGKVLDIAVRNKYCVICEKAEKLNKQAKDHICYKNWEKDRSSTSMEADTIAEGFKRSIEKRGLIYSTFIADGDSSVYKKIIESNPYPNVFIEKIECRNHLLRNLATKIKEIAKTKGRFGKLRNIIGSRILRIRTAVTKAVEHRNEEHTSMREKIIALKKDLENVISHVFGEHKDCAQIGYFCDGSQKENEENYVLDLKKVGLYEKLQNVLKQISWNARSLLQDKDSNRVETFNSVISKHIGGKRINFGLKGSYESRCNAAVVSFNTGEPLSRLSNVLGTKPGQNVLILEERKKEIRTKKLSDKKHNKRTFTHNKKRTATTDNDYGPHADRPDADPIEMELRIAQHMNMLQQWQMKRKDIEEETREQASTGIWHYYRTKLLTASHFGHICKMRTSTSCAPRVQSIVYPQELNMEALQHGTENEDIARQNIETILNIRINRCGLFIDAKIPFFGASPDGLIQNDGIVEIKCPFAARSLTPEDAITSNVSNLRALYQNAEDEHMKHSHIYYYQVQGQLHVTQREYCIFAIWTPLGLKMEKIFRDDNFWTEHMENKLVKFYEQCILPEIIDPRRERRMPIRDPDYIIEKPKSKKLKKKKEKV